MHDHVCSDANKGLGNAKVAEFDDGVVRVLVEERALKVSGPVSQPWEGAAGEVLNECNKNGPVRVRVVFSFKGNCEAGKELDPGESETRYAR